jgi:hypothetical protein
LKIKRDSTTKTNETSFIFPVQKSHTIKNKLLDVKKAISKQEMDRHRSDSGRGGMGNGYGNYGGSYGGELGDEASKEAWVHYKLVENL